MKDYYTIEVSFQNSTKLYTYKVPKEVKLEVGEPCLVMTACGLSIVKVRKIHTEPQDTMKGVEYKYISYSVLPITVEQVAPENAKARL